jgi:hypothetical protein
LGRSEKQWFGGATGRYKKKEAARVAASPTDALTAAHVDAHKVRKPVGIHCELGLDVHSQVLAGGVGAVEVEGRVEQAVLTGDLFRTKLKGERAGGEG